MVLFVHYFLPSCYYKRTPIDILSATGKIAYLNNVMLSAEVSKTVKNNTVIVFHN